MLAFDILSRGGGYVGEVAFEDGGGIEQTEVFEGKIFLLICMVIKLLFEFLDHDTRILINVAIDDLELERNDYVGGGDVPLIVGSSVEKAEHPIKSYNL